jgi:hypothetical protein
LDEKVKRKVLNLLQGKYKGFGPTLACEKLVEVEKLSISDETLRQIMIAEGLWKARKTAKPGVHQMRERRACFGELIQIDGSPQAWFEERGPVCTLLVLIDDATGKLLGLLFVDQESFHNYVRLVHTYFERCGKPVAFYSDKHGIFRVNQASREKGDAQTQFGRAMQQLGIDLLCANSPQAKGRIERVNQTLQDRLVKEMRLRHLFHSRAGPCLPPRLYQRFQCPLRRLAAQFPRCSPPSPFPRKSKPHPHLAGTSPPVQEPDPAVQESRLPDPDRAPQLCSA